MQLANRAPAEPSSVGRVLVGRDLRPLRPGTKVSNDRNVPASAILRVFCVDGPCLGVQYLDPDNGHVLFTRGSVHVYRVKDGDIVRTDVGPCPAAYFDHTLPTP